MTFPHYVSKISQICESVMLYGKRELRLQMKEWLLTLKQKEQHGQCKWAQSNQMCAYRERNGAEEWIRKMRCEMNSTCHCWLWRHRKVAMNQEMCQLLGVRNGSSFIASKKMGSSVLQPQGTKFFQRINEQENKMLPLETTDRNLNC